MDRLVRCVVELRTCHPYGGNWVHAYRLGPSCWMACMYSYRLLACVFKRHLLPRCEPYQICWLIDAVPHVCVSYIEDNLNIVIQQLYHIAMVIIPGYTCPYIMHGVINMLPIVPRLYHGCTGLYSIVLDCTQLYQIYLTRISIIFNCKI